MRKLIFLVFILLSLTLLVSCGEEDVIISFNTNGGNQIEDVNAVTLDLNELPIPVKDGYLFMGWFLDEELTESVGINTTFTSSVTLYAKWAPIILGSYTITFESNGGSFVAPIVAVEGSAITEPLIPIRIGYTFLGWFEDPLLTISAAFTMMPSQNKTFYADWEINTFSIFFESNGGGIYDAMELNYGTLISLYQLPEKVGYTFEGWYTDLELTVAFNITLMPALDLTLYAKWEPIVLNSYTLVFQTNGGTMLEPLVAVEGSSITLPIDLEKIGHSFMGWYLESSFVNPVTDEVMPNQNVIYYAKWEANEYQISFESNGGTLFDPINFVYNSPLLITQIPKKDGYNFDGWFLNPDLNIPLAVSLMPNTHLTLYARWAAIYYQIDFESNGGTIFNPIEISFGSPISITFVPEKDGYDFDGWYLDEDLVEPFNLSLMPNLEFTLYAKWSVKDYQISFESNGGTTFNPIELSFGSPISITFVPEKDGYDFDGWYLDEDLVEPFNLTLMPNFNFTVYAKWISSIVIVTITFDSLGGSEVLAITGLPGNPLIEPSIPIREGYVFTGWFESIESIDLYQFDVIPNDSFTLYADWGTEGLAYQLINDDLEYEVGIGDAYELSTIEIPKYYQGFPVTTIMDYGFVDASYMNVIYLKETLTTISPRGFLGASSLNHITLPNRLTTIGINAFLGCYSLASFEASDIHPSFKTIDGVLFSHDLEKLIRYPLAKEDSSYIVSDQVRVIGEYALSQVYNLTSIDLGSGVTTIMTHAFYETYNLKSLVIPNQVTTIELYAFRDCTGLEEVTLGSGITSISSYMFNNCSSLESIIIPYGVTFIGYGAFYGCSSLSSIYILRTSLNGLVSGSLFMLTYTPSYLVIYLPDQATVNAYKVATFWSSYASKMQVGTP